MPRIHSVLDKTVFTVKRRKDKNTKKLYASTCVIGLSSAVLIQATSGVAAWQIQHIFWVMAGALCCRPAGHCAEREGDVGGNVHCGVSVSHCAQINLHSAETL